MSVRPGKFTIDDSPIFEGYTGGNVWNGFSCPLFTLEQAKTVLKTIYGKEIERSEFKQDEYVWWYNPEKDTIFMNDPYYEQILEYKGENCKLESGEKIRLYDIGSGWCWDEEDPKLPDKLVMITFTPIPDSENPYPFKEHMIPGYTQITREILVMSQISYEIAINSLPHYASRRHARHEITVLIDKIPENEKIVFRANSREEVVCGNNDIPEFLKKSVSYEIQEEAPADIVTITANVNKDIVIWDIPRRALPATREAIIQSIRDQMSKNGIVGEIRLKLNGIPWEEKNPFYEVFNTAQKVDPVTLAEDPFYCHNDKVQFFINGILKEGKVNNCAGLGDCLVMGNDRKWYAGKDTNFRKIS